MDITSIVRRAQFSPAGLSPAGFGSDKFASFRVGAPEQAPPSLIDTADLTGEDVGGATDRLNTLTSGLLDAFEVTESPSQTLSEPVLKRVRRKVRRRRVPHSSAIAKGAVDLSKFQAATGAFNKPASGGRGLSRQFMEVNQKTAEEWKTRYDELKTKSANDIRADYREQEVGLLKEALEDLKSPAKSKATDTIDSEKKTGTKGEAKPSPDKSGAEKSKSESKPESKESKSGPQ